MPTEEGLEHRIGWLESGEIILPGLVRILLHILSAPRPLPILTTPRSLLQAGEGCILLQFIWEQCHEAQAKQCGLRMGDSGGSVFVSISDLGVVLWSVRKILI